MAGNEIFRTRMKQERTKKEITLKEVADFLGVKEATAQRYESGEIKTVPYEAIVSMAKMFNCSPAYLIGWENDNTETESEKMGMEDAKLLKKYHLLTKTQKQVVNNIIDELLQ